MTPLTAELTCSTFRPASFPRDRLPEIAFAGRSNVGKSSLINLLLGSRNIAHTSSTPGKTVGINFYKVNRSFYFVDLPGYGYSKVPESLREKWNGFLTGYLDQREQLLMTLLLIDSRMPPTDLDLQMRDWLRCRDRPITVVLTKADKVGRSQVLAAASRISRHWNCNDIFACSAKTGEGRNELLRQVFQILNTSQR